MHIRYLILSMAGVVFLNGCVTTTPPQKCPYEKLATSSSFEATTAEDGRRALVDKDYQKAFYILEFHATKGNPEAQYYLARMYDEGRGCLQEDYKKAYELFLSSAKQGYLDSEYRVAAHYEFYDIDIDKAIYWYTRSGDPIGMVTAAQLYEKRKDLDRAITLYTQAAEMGEGGAQYILGNRYSTGTGVPKDMEKAIYWWKKSAAQGFTNAQDKLDKLGY